MTLPPLLVLDTNILIDVLLQRGDGQSALLVELAERRQVDLVIPEYVLLEYRGTALRKIRDELGRIERVRGYANEWLQSLALDKPAEEIKSAVADLVARLRSLQSKVDIVSQRVQSVARVHRHTVELHVRGELRYLEGRPPTDELKDCRIYEAVLDIAKADRESPRRRYLVSRDGGFKSPELVAELEVLGVEIRSDPGRLYGELRASSPA